jgi:hypothetical protein
MRGGGETVDAGDLKSSVREDVWVRIPPALCTYQRRSDCERGGRCHLNEHSCVDVMRKT